MSAKFPAKIAKTKMLVYRRKFSKRAMSPRELEETLEEIQSKKDNKQEEESKESLAFKILSEEQILALKELTSHELEAKLAEIMNIDDFHISLPEAAILDYYVSGFWFTKEQSWTLQQSSAFFTLLKIVIDNIKDKHMTLSENFSAFKNLFAGVGMENCPISGGLECFSVSQAKLITDYFSEGLFQHYKLYEFLFHKQNEEEVISTLLKFEIAPSEDVPFPPPLDEGMTEDMWLEYIKTPVTSPQPDAETEIVERDDQEGQTKQDLKENEDVMSSIDPDVIKSIVRKTADDVFGNFKADVEAKLKERELNYTAKLAKN